MTWLSLRAPSRTLSASACKRPLHVSGVEGVGLAGWSVGRSVGRPGSAVVRLCHATTWCSGREIECTICGASVSCVWLGIGGGWHWSGWMDVSYCRTDRRWRIRLQWRNELRQGVRSRMGSCRSWTLDRFPVCSVNTCKKLST